MIPNSEFLNLLNDNEKQQEGKGVYTPVYTSVSELRFIVESWPELALDVKGLIFQLVDKFKN